MSLRDIMHPIISVCDPGQALWSSCRTDVCRRDICRGRLRHCCWPWFASRIPLLGRSMMDLLMKSRWSFLNGLPIAARLRSCLSLPTAPWPVIVRQTSSIMVPCWLEPTRNSESHLWIFLVLVLGTMWYYVVLRFAQQLLHRSRKTSLALWPRTLSTMKPNLGFAGDFGQSMQPPANQLLRLWFPLGLPRMNVSQRRLLVRHSAASCVAHGPQHVDGFRIAEPWMSLRSLYNARLRPISQFLPATQQPQVHGVNAKVGSSLFVAVLVVIFWYSPCSIVRPQQEIFSEGQDEAASLLACLRASEDEQVTADAFCIAPFGFEALQNTQRPFSLIRRLVSIQSSGKRRAIDDACARGQSRLPRGCNHLLLNHARVSRRCANTLSQVPSAVPAKINSSISISLSQVWTSIATSAQMAVPSISSLFHFPFALEKRNSHQDKNDFLGLVHDLSTVRFFLNECPQGSWISADPGPGPAWASTTACCRAAAQFVRCSLLVVSDGFKPRVDFVVAPPSSLTRQSFRVFQLWSARPTKIAQLELLAARASTARGFLDLFRHSSVAWYVDRQPW